MAATIPNCGAFGRGTQRQAEPAEDPWAYARRCAETFPQGCGQVILNVQGGKVVQVDKTEKRRFDR